MGQKFAAYDGEGNIIAFYDSVDSPPPESASVISITDAQWQTCIDQPGQWMVSNGSLAEVPAPTAAQQLATAQASQLATIGAACAAAITGGFTSTALGTAYTYPSAMTDQANLTSAVTASQLPANASDANWTVPFMCADASGVWARRPHTAAQIQQVGQDAVTHIVSALEKKDGLEASINGATTVAAVQAVSWS